MKTTGNVKSKRFVPEIVNSVIRRKEKKSIERDA